MTCELIFSWQHDSRLFVSWEGNLVCVRSRLHVYMAASAITYFSLSATAVAGLSSPHAILLHMIPSVAATFAVDHEAKS